MGKKCHLPYYGLRPPYGLRLLPELADLARAFPGTRIIVNHIAGLIAHTRTYTARKDEAIAVWKKGFTELATCPNVYVKLGGLGMPYRGLRPQPLHVREQLPARTRLGGLPGDLEHIQAHCGAVIREREARIVFWNGEPGVPVGGWIELTCDALAKIGI